MMSNILFHIDNRDLAAGDLVSPFVLVQSEAEAGGVHVTGNRAGLETYIERLRDLGVTGASGPWETVAPLMNDGELRNALTHLRTGELPEEACETLGDCPNLISLGITSQAPVLPLSAAVPKLRFLTIGKLRAKSLDGLVQLQGLSLLQGANQLDRFESKTLKRLFVSAASPSVLQVCKQFESLETLSIFSRKKNWSFTTLGDYASLRNFAFDGPVDQEWLSLPQHLEKVSIEKVDDTAAVGAHLKGSRVVSIGFNPKVIGDEGYYRGDLLRSGDPFRSLETDITYADIS